MWFTELQNRISKTNYTGTVCEIINFKANTTDNQAEVSKFIIRTFTYQLIGLFAF